MEALRVGSLIAATLTTGLMAGLFYAYACSVMLGLRGADDRTFIDVMQRINVAIVNAWFLPSFLGALALSALAAALHVGHPALPWIVAGLVLYGVAFGATVAVNIPLNNALEAAGPPDDIADLAAVRERFEAKWVRWNVLRAVTSTAALASLTVALLQVE